MCGPWNALAIAANGDGLCKLKEAEDEPVAGPRGGERNLWALLLFCNEKQLPLSAKCSKIHMK